MRFMVIVKANKDSEAGVMQAAEGLQPQVERRAREVLSWKDDRDRRTVR